MFIVIGLTPGDDLNKFQLGLTPRPPYTWSMAPSNCTRSFLGMIPPRPRCPAAEVPDARVPHVTHQEDRSRTDNGDITAWESGEDGVFIVIGLTPERPLLLA